MMLRDPSEIISIGQGSLGGIIPGTQTPRTTMMKVRIEGHARKVIDRAKSACDNGHDTS